MPLLLVHAGEQQPLTARFDDLGPEPIGFAFELASNSMIDRTPPQAILPSYFETV